MTHLRPVVADVVANLEAERVAVETERGFGVGVRKECVMDADVHGVHGRCASVRGASSIPDRSGSPVWRGTRESLDGGGAFTVHAGCETDQLRESRAERAERGAPHFEAPTPLSPTSHRAVAAPSHARSAESSGRSTAIRRRPRGTVGSDAPRTCAHRLRGPARRAASHTRGRCGPLTLLITASSRRRSSSTTDTTRFCHVAGSRGVTERNAGGTFSPHPGARERYPEDASSQHLLRKGSPPCLNHSRRPKSLFKSIRVTLAVEPASSR